MMIHDVKDELNLQDSSQEPLMSSKYDLVWVYIGPSQETFISVLKLFID